MMRRIAFAALLVLSVPFPIARAAEEKKMPALDGLRPFNALAGKWKASGVPEGSIEERNKGHWLETLACEYQFKGDDVWIAIVFEKGKYFDRGELRHLPKEDQYQFRVTTIEKQALIFHGTFKDKTLTLERTEEKTRDVQRLVFSLLHSNRIVYRAEVKPADKTFFNKLYRVGATKDGEPFVEVGFNEKECVVSGGAGTSTVMYMGRTYYVCCSGCKDEFNDNPAKYVAEFEKKRAEFNKKK